jgi:tetratricopeptide (TPR) repeat protein
LGCALLCWALTLFSFPAFADEPGEAAERAAEDKLEGQEWTAAAAQAEGVIKLKSAPANVKRHAKRTYGIAQLRLGRAKEARENLLAAVAQDSNDTLAAMRLGEAEEALGLHREAKGRLEAVRMKIQLDAHAHVALANAAYAVGDFRAARTELDEALTLEPDNGGALALKQRMDKAKKGPR